MVNYLELEGKAFGQAIETTYEHHKTATDLCLLGILAVGGSLLKLHALNVEGEACQTAYKAGTAEFEKLISEERFRDAVYTKPMIKTNKHGDPEVTVKPFKGGSEWLITFPILEPEDQLAMSGDNWKRQFGQVTMRQRGNLLTYHHPDVGTVELDKIYGTAKYYSPDGILWAELNRLGDDIRYRNDGSIEEIAPHYVRHFDIARFHAY